MASSLRSTWTAQSVFDTVQILANTLKITEIKPVILPIMNSQLAIIVEQLNAVLHPHYVKKANLVAAAAEGKMKAADNVGSSYVIGTKTLSLDSGSLMFYGTFTAGDSVVVIDTNSGAMYHGVVASSTSNTIVFTSDISGGAGISYPGAAFKTNATLSGMFYPYVLPADCRMALHILDSGNSKTIEFKDERYIPGANENSLYSLSAYAFVRGDAVDVWKGSSYGNLGTLVLTYLREVDKLTDLSGIIDLPDEYMDIFINRVLRKVYEVAGRADAIGFMTNDNQNLLNNILGGYQLSSQERTEDGNMKAIRGRDANRA